LLARIARVALSFKCKAPTGEAQSPRSSPTPAHKTARRAAPCAERQPIPSAGEPARQSSRFAARPDRDRAAFASPSRSTAVSAELPNWRAAPDRGATDDVEAIQSTFRQGELPTPGNLGRRVSPVRGISRQGQISQRSAVATESMGDVMRLTFKLHDTSPPFVELCLETWRQDAHGSAPIISPHLTTANEIRQSCANFRAQIDRVEREATAALVAKKKTP
jgi:hypothetical protein